MRVTFDPALDAGGWPGPLQGRRAVVGEAWLGPRGLLDRLELELGLGAPPQSSAQRAAALIPQLRDRGGWWRGSFEADPIATVRRLLHDRDTLMLWGWRGERTSDRLDELWDVTRAASPGIPDRLSAVARALRAGYRVDIEQIEVFAGIESLEPAWTTVFELLAAGGVTIGTRALVDALAGGDLARALTTPFDPVGDGTLTLYRPHGAVAAADAVAGALAAMDDLDGVLVVGCDELLDRALRRQGLPGAAVRLAAPASSSAIRLIIEAAFHPMDPTDLHELLVLDPGPVPRRVGARLVRALREMPGRGAAEWCGALDDALEGYEEEPRAALSERLATFLTPAARSSERIQVAEVERRLIALESWAYGRAIATPTVEAVAGRAASLRRMIGATGATEHTLVELRRLCDDVDGDGGARPGEAGLAHVGRPGGVLGPAEIIVWWDFARRPTAASGRLRLSAQERASLTAQGITPPDPGRLLTAESVRWRRPLTQSRRALVLVCPRTDDDGGPRFPHPLWDELVAAMPRPQLATKIESRELSTPAVPRRALVALRAMPTALTRIETGAPIPPRTLESPSSLERLAGCSLSWALGYHARVRDGLSAPIARPDAVLSGNIAHRIIARVFEAGVPEADAAVAAARDLLGAELVSQCESLGLPQYQLERSAIADVVTSSVRELVRVMAEVNAALLGVERPFRATIGGVEVEGFVDMVLAEPPLVVDLKWGKRANRQRLVDGTALQLAVYAELVAATTGSRPEVAYFILRTQELLGAPGCAMPGVSIPGVATAAETWNGALYTIRARAQELVAGVLVAPGADGSEIEGQLSPGQLVLEPPCRYCGHGGLCGRTGGA